MSPILEPVVTFRQELIVPFTFVTIEPMVTQDSKETFSARLNEALDDAGFTPKHQGRQVALAKKYGVSQKGARKWLEGEAIPEFTRLAQIAIDFSVSIEWLALGRGAKNAPRVFDHQIENVITILLQLGPDDRTRALRVIDSLAQSASEISREIPPPNDKAA